MPQPFLLFVLAVLQSCSYADQLARIPRSTATPYNRVNSDIPVAIVVGNKTESVNAAIVALKVRGYRVLERSNLDMVFEEQGIHLSNASDKQADMLRVGRIMGAAEIVLAETTITNGHMNVTVRSISVETGEILWSGQAWYRVAILPGDGFRVLTTRAIEHALCPSERWDDWKGCR